jgi:hypothetical protein
MISLFNLEISNTSLPLLLSRDLVSLQSTGNVSALLQWPCPQPLRILGVYNYTHR